MTEKKQKPVHEIRMETGRAAIWKNQNDKGVWHNVTVERIYREEDEWKSSSSFGKDGLIALSKVTDRGRLESIRSELERYKSVVELVDAPARTNSVELDEFFREWVKRT